MSIPSPYLIRLVLISEMPAEGLQQGARLAILGYYSHAELLWVMCAHPELRQIFWFQLLVCDPRGQYPFIVLPRCIKENTGMLLLSL